MRLLRVLVPAEESQAQGCRILPLADAKSASFFWST
jgi:hypothetical protein